VLSLADTGWLQGILLFVVFFFILLPIADWLVRFRVRKEWAEWLRRGGLALNPVDYKRFTLFVWYSMALGLFIIMLAVTLPAIVPGFAARKPLLLFLITLGGLIAQAIGSHFILRSNTEN
jgi:hypothetical protein